MVQLLHLFAQIHLHNGIDPITSNQEATMSTREIIGYVLRAATLLAVTIALVVLIVWLWNW